MAKKNDDYRLTKHHLYYPRRDYQTSELARAFRELPENIVMVQNWYHNQLHRWQSPPRMPDVETMLAAIAMSVDSHRYRHLLRGTEYER